MPWRGVTDLVVSVSSLVVHENATITAHNNWDADYQAAWSSGVANWAKYAWPLAWLRDAAQGNGTRALVAVHLPIKGDAEPALFRMMPAVIVAAAMALVETVVEARYDGFQLDIEGLAPAAKDGYQVRNRLL